MTEPSSVKLLKSTGPHLQPNQEKKDRNKHTQTKRTNLNEDNHIPDNLFDVLPFKDDNTQDEEYKPFACIPYIPGLSYRLKRALTKAGVNTVFKSGRKLVNILCDKNKTKTDPSEKKGVYRYTCPKRKKVYIGQTSRSCQIRWKEHKRAIEKGQWSHSGISQHHQHCDEPFDTANCEVIKTMSNKNKKKLNYDLKVWEAFKIKKHNCGPGRGLNEDWGAYVKTDAWNPVFSTMDYQRVM